MKRERYGREWIVWCADDREAMVVCSIAGADFLKAAVGSDDHGTRLVFSQKQVERYDELSKAKRQERVERALKRFDGEFK